MDNSITKYRINTDQSPISMSTYKNSTINPFCCRTSHYFVLLTLSYALEMSSEIAPISWPLPEHTPAWWRNLVIAIGAEKPRRHPNWSSRSGSSVLRRSLIIPSRIFARQQSRDIGRAPPPGFAIGMTSACFQGCGYCPAWSISVKALATKLSIRWFSRILLQV